MKLTILQLNIYGGTYWDNLIPYITSHDFDILQLQEMTGKNTQSGKINSPRDTFTDLKQILKNKYNAELAIGQRYASSPKSYMGNATFYKKIFTLQKKYILTLHERSEPFSSDVQTYEDLKRNLLHLELLYEGQIISFLNTHFGWAKTPKEEPHQTKQGEILINYLKTVPHPFILTGDFNLDAYQPTIQKINQLAENLITKNTITNTLNPRTHRIKELFPPGVAVDYVFVSKDITVKQFSVMEEDLSDHFGLIAEIEV